MPSEPGKIDASYVNLILTKINSCRFLFSVFADADCRDVISLHHEGVSFNALHFTDPARGAEYVAKMIFNILKESEGVASVIEVVEDEATREEEDNEDAVSDVDDGDDDDSNEDRLPLDVEANDDDAAVSESSPQAEPVPAAPVPATPAPASTSIAADPSNAKCGSFAPIDPAPATATPVHVAPVAVAPVTVTPEPSADKPNTSESNTGSTRSFGKLTLSNSAEGHLQGLVEKYGNEVEFWTDMTRHYDGKLPMRVSHLAQVTIKKNAKDWVFYGVVFRRSSSRDVKFLCVNATTGNILKRCIVFAGYWIVFSSISNIVVRLPCVQGNCKNLLNPILKL